MKTFNTNNCKQTQKLGGLLAQELKGGEIICLTGKLGSGKTTFSQGVLKGLGAKGPHTSPTFVVMKHYRVTRSIKRVTQNKKNKELRATSRELRDVYHIDAYRVGPKDIQDLGWEEIVAGKKNIIIIEWAERIKRIVPESAVWIKFQHLKEKERKISAY